MLRLDFRVTSIFCLHHVLYKIHTWKLFAYGKIKSGRETLVKKGKNKEEKNSVKIRNKFLCESDWYWRSSTLASRFRTKKSPSSQNVPYIMLKARFPFLYASVDTKTLTTAGSPSMASNRNLESCLYIRCPAPQHIFQFFHFCCGIFFCFWQLCSLLFRPPQRSTNRVCNGLLFPEDLDLSSLTPGGSVVPLVLGFKRRDNLTGVARVVGEPLWAKISHLILGGIQPLWPIL